MLSIGSKDLYSYLPLLPEWRDTNKIDELIKKANDYDLDMNDILQLNIFFNDLFCIYHLNEQLLAYIKEIRDYLESEDFGKLVDGLEIESKEPNLYQELLLSRVIAQAIVDNDYSLTSYLELLLNTNNKIIQILYEMHGNTACNNPDNPVPENAKELITSLLTD
ncbi:MAG TPA: hypothetical protein PLS98_07560 [Dictyoglomaceae bacterium]|nr:hypothetical protein [Dictyoglomaceae bacterium]